MNDLYLLKLIADLLEGEKVSSEKLSCAKTILNNLIKEYTSFTQQPQVLPGAVSNIPIYSSPPNPLDIEAQQAKEDLIG